MLLEEIHKLKKDVTFVPIFFVMLYLVLSVLACMKSYLTGLYGTVDSYDRFSNMKDPILPINDFLVLLMTKKRQINPTEMCGTPRRKSNISCLV